MRLGSVGRLGNCLEAPSLGCRWRKAFRCVHRTLEGLEMLPSSERGKKLNDFNAWKSEVLELLRRAWRASKRSPSGRSGADRRAFALRNQNTPVKTEYVFGLPHG